MFFLLFHYSLELTGENLGVLWDEHIYFGQESILFNAVKILCSMVILYFVGMLSRFLTIKFRRNTFLAV